MIGSNFYSIKISSLLARDSILVYSFDISLSFRRTYHCSIGNPEPPYSTTTSSEISPAQTPSGYCLFGISMKVASSFSQHI